MKISIHSGAVATCAVHAQTLLLAMQTDTVSLCHTHRDTLHGPELASFPGKLEFPYQRREGELSREDRGEMYGGGETEPSG